MNFPFDAVLFDLDGVIINTTPLHYRVWDVFARRRGYIPTQAELLATNGVRAAETMRLWFGAGLSDADIDALTAEQAAYINEVLDSESVDAIPGVHEYIASLVAANVPRADHIHTGCAGRTKSGLAVFEFHGYPGGAPAGKVTPSPHFVLNRAAARTKISDMSYSNYSQQDVEPLLEALRQIASRGSGAEAQKAQDALQQWDAMRQNAATAVPPPPSPLPPAAAPARRRYKPEPL